MSWIWVGLLGHRRRQSGRPPGVQVPDGEALADGSLGDVALVAGTDVFGADVSGADVVGADVVGADVVGADVVGVTETEALPVPVGVIVALGLPLAVPVSLGLALVLSEFDGDPLSVGLTLGLPLSVPVELGDPLSVALGVPLVSVPDGLPVGVGVTLAVGVAGAEVDSLLLGSGTTGPVVLSAGLGASEVSEGLGVGVEDVGAGLLVVVLVDGREEVLSCVDVADGLVVVGDAELGVGE